MGRIQEWRDSKEPGKQDYAKFNVYPGDPPSNRKAELAAFLLAVRPVFEKYKGIGVRIEDDVVITAGERKVISAGMPSKLEEVEASIAKLRAATKSSPLQ